MAVCSSNTSESVLIASDMEQELFLWVWLQIVMLVLHIRCGWVVNGYMNRMSDIDTCWEISWTYDVDSYTYV